MTLTPELVARVSRDVEDPGRDPTLAYHTDDDYQAVVQALLASHPGGPDTWLFAYGSLIWRPEVEHLESRKGTARGWHRSFCFRIVRFRGTREQPGLMMSLDRGGQCQGVLYRLSHRDLEAQFAKLVRREMTVKPPNNLPRWIAVDTPEGPVSAVAFVMNRQSCFYTGRLPPEEVADVISRACGHWGSCAEYLHNTVAHLEEQGIHDRRLWRLQQLVAERIERAGPCL
jgi:glutathione-specific gamma-glutamylcyclotransferase